MKYLALLPLFISGCSLYDDQQKYVESTPVPIEHPVRQVISPPENMKCLGEISSHGIAITINVPTIIKDFGTYFLVVAEDDDLLNVPMISGTLKKDLGDHFFSKKNEMSFFVYPSDGLYLVFYKKNGQIRRLRVQCL